MFELQEKIRQCKTMAELDELRLPIVKASKEASIAECNDTQNIFRKQKNKIKRHGGKID